MRRSAIPLALLAALFAAGLGVWGLSGGGSDGPEAGESGLPERDAPWTTLAPRFALRGTVRDEEGNAVGGVRVGIRRAGSLAWDRSAADPRLAPADHRARVLEAQIAEGPGAAPPWERVLDADAAGAFQVGVPDEADYEFGALVEGGRIGLRQFASARPGEEGDLDLRVARAVLREGRLLDAEGRPAAGIVGGALSDDAQSRVEPCRTDPTTGAFVLRAPEGSRLALHAVLPGTLLCRFPDLPAQGEQPLLLQLPPREAALEGRVFAPQGRAVVGATVLLRIHPSRSVAHEGNEEVVLLARTDAAGVFRAGEVPQGLLGEVAVRAPGFVQAGPPEERFVEARGLRAGGRARIDVPVEPAEVLEGHVLHEETRAPVPGAHVRVRVERGPEEDVWVSTVSDEGGAWRIEELPPGRVTILASARGLVPSSVLGRVAARNRRLRDVVLPTDDVLWLAPGAGGATRTVTLRAGRTLEGTVLGPDGAPVAGARVRVEDPELARPWRFLAGRAVTGADGRFRIEGLPPSPFLLPTAEAKGGPWAVGEPVDATGPAPLAPVVLRFPRGATLAGVVLDEAGEPIADAAVTWDYALRRGLKRARTAPDGTFRLEGLEAGPGDLILSHPCHVMLTQSLADLRPGEAREGLRSTLPRGARLAGVLVDAAGGRIPGGHIAVEEADGRTVAYATTDEEGRFALENARAGPLRYTAWRNRTSSFLGSYYLDLEVEGGCSAPCEDLRVALPGEAKPRWLDVTIVDPAGVPVPQAVLSCAVGPRDEDPPALDAPARESFEVIRGRARLQLARGLQASAFVVFARDERGEALDAYGPLVRLPDEPPGSEPEAPVEIRLVRGGTIGGLVRTQDGRGIPGVLVETRWSAAFTGPDGRYLLRGQPSEDQLLRIQPPEGFVEPVYVKAAVGVAVSDAVLEPADVILGRLLVAGDAAPRWGRVHAEWSFGPGRRGSETASTHAGGWFRLGGLPKNGTVRLEGGSPLDGRFARAVLQGVRVGTRDLVVRLPPAAPIEGRVLDAAGRPASRVWIRAATPAGVFLDFEITDAEGRFRFADFEAGDYDLIVVEGLGTPGRTRLRVRAPASGVVLSPRRSLRSGGQVVGEGDLSGFVVEAVDDAVPSTVFGSTRVSPDGSFFLRFDGAPPFRLVARGDGDPRYATSDPLRSDAEGVDLVLRPGAGIEGRVRSLSGSLPAGIEVGARGTVWYARVPCDAEGRFRFAGLPFGRYRLEGHVPGIAPEIVLAVDAGARDVELVVP